MKSKDFREPALHHWFLLCHFHSFCGSLMSLREKFKTYAAHGFRYWGVVRPRTDKRLSDTGVFILERQTLRRITKTQQWLDRRDRALHTVGKEALRRKGYLGCNPNADDRDQCAQRYGDDGGNYGEGSWWGGERPQGTEGPIHPAAQVTRGNCYLLGFFLWGYFQEGLAEGKALPKWGPSYNEIWEKNILPATSISSLLLLHILKLPPAFTEYSSYSPPTDWRETCGPPGILGAFSTQLGLL